MFGKLNKKSAGGGFKTPYKVTFPLTATDDGIGNIYISPTSSETAYVYVLGYDENNVKQGRTAAVLSQGGAIATNAFAIKKGWRYDIDAQSGVEYMTVTMYPLG